MASSKRVAVILAVLCVFVLGAQLSMAATPAPAPSVDCLSTVLGLSDCLPYVMGNASKPPSACCKEVKPVIADSPQCLCLLFNKTLIAGFGLTINTTVALQLPSACKLDAPDPNLCTVLGYDVTGAPSPSPAPSTSKHKASSPKASSSTSTSPSAPSTSAASSSSNSATPSSSPRVLRSESLYASVFFSIGAVAVFAL